MDLLVAVIVLAAIALPTVAAARKHARLGIVAHPGDSDAIATALDAEESLVDETTLRARRASEWHHWYQLGNS